VGRTAIAIVAACVTSAGAQTLNVNFAPSGHTPSASYGAAGTAGAWSTVTGIAGPAYDLVDIDGASGITLTQSPTTTLLATSDPSVRGDDATLLNNGLVTNGAETCLMFSGFHPGTYEVFIYAWLPNQPAVLSRTRQDEAPSTIDVGGAWTGAHAEGVTYARYVVTVGSDGNLPAHSGLVPNAPAAALNAVQIRPLGSGGGGDDAGTGSNGGGGDAGTDTMHHGGGCASTNGAGLLVILALLGLRRRSN
jgi:hypothetical protein